MKYRWGYLFVRFVKIIALFLFLCGLVFGAFVYHLNEIEIARTAYQASSLLSSKLQLLHRLATNSFGQIIGFRQIHALPQRSTQAIPPFKNAYITSGDFATLSQALDRAESTINDLKIDIVYEFDEAADQLIVALETHAKNLNPDQPKPKSQPPKATIKVNQERESRGLYSLELTKEEIAGRLAYLEQAKSFFQVLQANAEQEESKTRISSAMHEIDIFSELLPMWFDEKVNNQDASERRPTETPRKLGAAEKVAVRLKEMKYEVHSSILNSWAVDKVLDQTRELFDAEKIKCSVAEQENRMLRLWIFGKEAAILFITCFICFLLLVSADIVQSHLDNAIDTNSMAGYYTTGGPATDS